MRHFAAITTLVLAACPAPTSTPPGTEGESRQLMIVDAGGSGTRARVFEYQPGRPSTLALIGTPCENDFPLAVDIRGVVESFECAREFTTDPAATPVVVYATGGMRTLAEVDPGEAELRYRQVQSALAGRGVERVEARTIPGTDEAFYQWVGVNHREGRLNGADTVTIVEFGSASVQVAFAAGSAAGEELRTAKLGGREFQLVLRSWDHCGMREAREAFAGPACFPADCLDDPQCAEALPPGTAPIGGPIAVCEQALVAALGTSSRCRALSAPPPPLPDQPIRFISSLGSVFESLHAVDGDRVDLARARESATGVCGSSWIELDEALADTSARRRGWVCFASVLALTVLDAWGIGPDDPRPTIDRGDDSWTWGVARELAEG